MEASPLGRLPAELRVHIWQLTLTVSSPVQIACFTTSSRKKDPNSLKSGVAQLSRCNLSALLVTCKQIRCEALPIFYECNSFDISLSPLDYIHKDSRPPPTEILEPIKKFAASLGKEKPSSLKIIVDAGTFDMNAGWYRVGDTMWPLARALILCSRYISDHLCGEFLLRFKMTYECYVPPGSKLPNNTLDLEFRGGNVNESIDTICETMAQLNLPPSISLSGRVVADGISFMRKLKEEEWTGEVEGFKFDQSFSLI